MSFFFPDPSAIDSIEGGIPGVVVLAFLGLPSGFFLIRWMVRFQREFADFYAQENKKLRDDMATIREDNARKDEDLAHCNRAILAQERKHDEEIRQLRRELDDNTRTIADHEATINRLNRIIDRRKLED